MVDIARKKSRTKYWIVRVGLLATLIVVVGGVSIGVSLLRPAAPTVDRATVWIDAVTRGDMVRRVRGSGKLEPLEIRWITPDSNGRVERIPVEPGAKVTPDTLVLELSNQELELAVEEAKLKLKSSESEVEAKKVEFEQEILNLQSSAARLDADLIEAQLRAKSEKELAKDGLISELQLEVSTVRAEELAKLKEIEDRRVEIQRQYSENLLQVLAAQVDQASGLYALKQRQLDSLRVRARFEGVLEQILVEEGQQVDVTTNLAKVSDPEQLKAVLQIDQNQVREVSAGLPVDIDLRNSTIKGRVSRIDPSVQEGSVSVDVVLDDPLPSGARPDQTLNGSIEIETLVDVLHVGRPVYGQPNAQVNLFRVSGDESEATRVSAQLGRGSVNSIEILEGLSEGDRVILSDMSKWDDVDRVRLR